MLLMPEALYNQFPLTMDPFMKFTSTNKEYSRWLDNHSYFTFYKADLFDFPNNQTIDDCEKLFDKNVLPIKKLVKDISDLNDLVITKTKDFFLYDNSNFIQSTFFTELNKNIQAYGYISSLYNNRNNRLISSKNKLKFNVLADTEERS